jgi:hypothetical protein
MSKQTPVVTVSAPIVQATVPVPQPEPEPEPDPIVTVTPVPDPIVLPTPQASTKKSQVDVKALLNQATQDLINSQPKASQAQSVEVTKVPEPASKPQDNLEGGFVGSLEDLDKGQGNNVGAPIQEGTPNDMQSIQDSRVNNPCTTGDEYCGTDRNSHTASNEAKYGSRTPDFINSNN